MTGRERIPLSETLDFLRRELEYIHCRKAIIEADYRADQIKADGWPKASASQPRDPGIVLRVIESKYGPLTYPCDTFTRHEDNLRAIALTLDAQRMIDRYGVTRRGEQYQGWAQLPAHGTATLTAEAAAAILVAYSNGDADSSAAIAMRRALLGSPSLTQKAYRAAAIATHPDAGGDVKRFQDVQSARDVLARHHGITL